MSLHDGRVLISHWFAFLENLGSVRVSVEAWWNGEMGTVGLYLYKFQPEFCEIP